MENGGTSKGHSTNKEMAFGEIIEGQTYQTDWFITFKYGPMTTI